MAERDPNQRDFRNYPGYLEDYGAWIAAQVDLLRTESYDELDLENLIDEVEGLARSDFRAFVSAIKIVLLHMLKWDVQTDYQCRSWSDSIDEHRCRVSRELDDSPSYRTRLDDAMRRAFRDARYAAAKETRLPHGSFPEECPFSFDEMMAREHIVRIPPDRVLNSE